MNKDHIFNRFESVALQIEELETLCVEDAPQIQGMSADIIDAVAQMVTQATKVCPCCMEEAVLEDEALEVASVSVELVDEQIRASLFSPEQGLVGIGDWVDIEEGKVTFIEVAAALRYLAESLELKYKGVPRQGS